MMLPLTGEYGLLKARKAPDPNFVTMGLLIWTSSMLPVREIVFETGEVFPQRVLFC
jgi:hypothetical protein